MIQDTWHLVLQYLQWVLAVTEYSYMEYMIGVFCKTHTMHKYRKNKNILKHYTSIYKISYNKPNEFVNYVYGAQSNTRSTSGSDINATAHAPEPQRA